MNLKILFIDDEAEIRENLVKLFDKETIAEYTLNANSAESFEKGIEMIKKFDYDIIILDLCQGKPGEQSEKPGLDVLKEIQSQVFIPVIFYSGLTKDIYSLSSEIVGVVNKGDGIDKLKLEIERIISSKIALIKGQIYDHIRESLRKYFWDTVHTDKKVFDPIKNDVSLGYLLLRRLANSLSKENIKTLLGDDKIKNEKAHPMEFYIYPSNNGEFEAGEILLLEDKYYAILTPSCDLVLRSNGQRKADKILLAAANKFNNLPDFQKFDTLKRKTDRNEKENQQLSNFEGKLKTWISNNGGEKDRYFFLPFTPFIDNMVIDFQNKVMVKYEDLANYSRIAKLDSPFAESMISSFVRFYNRIGFPDIDAEYVISSLK